MKIKDLAPHERIIFALDVASLSSAKKYIKCLQGKIGVLKVGLELFVSEGPSVLGEIAKESDLSIFLDMKFHDIPETVSRAVQSANRHRAKFLTVHCDDGAKLLERVSRVADKETRILGVTVLTSISKEDLKVIGFRSDLEDPTRLVLHRARIAKEAGCAGVVCSGHEVEAVKASCGEEFLAVVPGVRPQWSLVKGDDQSRVVTPSMAFERGADYIVVGRPIRDADNPATAAEKIAKEIAEGLKKRN